MKFSRPQKELQVCRYPQVVCNQPLETTMLNNNAEMYNCCGYTHFGFGAFRKVNGLGLVQLRFHVTLGDAVTQYKTALRVKYN